MHVAPNSRHLLDNTRLQPNSRRLPAAEKCRHVLKSKWSMQVQKKKIWEAVQPDLKTNGRREVVYKGAVMTTGAGPVMAPTLANAIIS